MNRKAFTSLLLVLGAAAVSGFAASAQGWKTRSAVLQLAQSSSREGETETKSTERQPWDAFRFMKQSSTFVLGSAFGKKDRRTIEPGNVLWTPGAGASSTFQFAPLDDVVMGGVSSSTFDNDTGLWRGKVTDANNGGFIGIRSTPSLEWNMASCKGIQLKLKSKSPKTQRFKFVVRDSTDFNGIGWTTSINVGGSNNSVMKLFSKGESNVATIRVPFQDLIPTIFARTVPDQTFRNDNVVGVQLTYSKFEYDGDLNPNFALGDLDLQILEISAY